MVVFEGREVNNLNLNFRENNDVLQKSCPRTINWQTSGGVYPLRKYVN